MTSPQRVVYVCLARLHGFLLGEVETRGRSTNGVDHGACLGSGASYGVYTSGTRSPSPAVPWDQRADARPTIHRYHLWARQTRATADQAPERRGTHRSRLAGCVLQPVALTTRQREHGCLHRPRGDASHSSGTLLDPASGHRGSKRRSARVRQSCSRPAAYVGSNCCTGGIAHVTRSRPHMKHVRETISAMHERWR